ncbi:hypothetical protein BS78_08G099600 [Paspalum vaginatum]|nr:hypothetical protein BS78_08G099600 [Paspalum vaginatum]
MSPSPPLAGALLQIAAAVAFLLAALAAGPAAAAASGQYGGGRMVIIHAPTSRTPVVVGAAGTKWQWHYRRVEDEVAPEFGGGGRQLAEGSDRHIGYEALHPNKPFCPPRSQCAAKGGRGGSATHRCTYRNLCPQNPSTPTAAVHA